MFIFKNNKFCCLLIMDVVGYHLDAIDNVFFVSNRPKCSAKLRYLKTAVYPTSVSYFKTVAMQFTFHTSSMHPQSYSYNVTYRLHCNLRVKLYIFT